MNIRSWLTGFVLIPLLDFFWLGTVAQPLYRGWLAPWAKTGADGSMQVDWIAAIAVYLLLPTGLEIFVVRPASGVRAAMAKGALFGLIVYGVYEFTNRSFIAEWPWPMVAADTAWGGVLCALVAGAMEKIKRYPLTF